MTLKFQFYLANFKFLAIIKLIKNYTPYKNCGFNLLGKLALARKKKPKYNFSYYSDSHTQRKTKERLACQSVFQVP